MKQLTNILITICCTLLLSACGESVDDSMKDIGQYTSIYIRQAYSYPNSIQLDVSADEQFIPLNVCLGGYVSNDRNITVQVEIAPELVDEFNAENKTNYQALSPAAYTLLASECLIPAGKLNSEMINISLTTLGYIVPGQSWLLPVTIKSTDSDHAVSNTLKTVYFLISGAYPLGEEPPVQVFNTSGRIIQNLFTFYNYLVICEPVAGNNAMEFYAHDAETGTFNPNYTPPQWGGWSDFNWTGAYVDAIISRYPDGRIIWYSWDRNTAQVIANRGVLINGTDVFDKLIPSINHQCLFCVEPAGKMYAYPITGPNSVETAIEMGTGWEVYAQILMYGNNMLAVDGAGDLWLIPIDDQKNVGEKEKIGSGWNKYSHITAFGNDLLALDANGIVWLYKFDPNGFWTVKD
ncbi:MAG: DUF1735 domain-containing protein [Dysgonamonadaceae bacterium]|jgi:hypothetical protein|nr:DUF1735 domain-containing protein [Dysgonamonadaceae bacterium]